jgi:hypothetical protein
MQSIVQAVIFSTSSLFRACPELVEGKTFVDVEMVKFFLKEIDQ